MSDLEKVEPAVLEAQQAVKGIKKQHLVEVRYWELLSVGAKVLYVVPSGSLYGQPTGHGETGSGVYLPAA